MNYLSNYPPGFDPRDLDMPDADMCETCEYAEYECQCDFVFDEYEGIIPNPNKYEKVR